MNPLRIDKIGLECVTTVWLLEVLKASCLRRAQGTRVLTHSRHIRYTCRVQAWHITLCFRPPPVMRGWRPSGSLPLSQRSQVMTNHMNFFFTLLQLRSASRKPCRESVLLSRMSVFLFATSGTRTQLTVHSTQQVAHSTVYTAHSKTHESLCAEYCVFSVLFASHDQSCRLVSMSVS